MVYQGIKLLKGLDSSENHAGVLLLV